MILLILALAYGSQEINIEYRNTIFQGNFQRDVVDAYYQRIEFVANSVRIVSYAGA